MPLPPLAISLGEPGGVGPDLVLQLFSDRLQYNLPPFVVYGPASILRQRAASLRLDVNIAHLESAADLDQVEDRLPVLDVGGDMQDHPGELHVEYAQCVIDSISHATADTLAGNCRGLVTAPIHKSVLYQVGFNHPGHTEFLAELCTNDGVTPLPVMMLAHDAFRVVPLTIHVPLTQVPGLVTADLITETAHIVTNDLKSRFGITKPKLAICGLNPHAGEDGTIGTEDRDIIAPAIDELQENDIDAVGPLSADTLFHPAHWQQYDAVIAMYHDQALIPIKTLAFDAGVNVTLGLPIVRTSPDHGTALGLAGSGKASVNSMLAAIRLADKMSGGTG